MENRNDYLMKRALEIWPTLISVFKPTEKLLDTYSLDDDVSLSGRKISRFSYQNIEQPVTSWIEMYEQVLKILHTEDKSIISKLSYARHDTMGLSQYFNDNKRFLRGYTEIEDGLYAEKNTSTETKISVLRKLFKLYNADESDLVFYLRDENENEDIKAGSIYEQRKNYWIYALNYIHKAHGDNGSFSNVNSTKNNYIHGYLGLRGFSIACVANSNSSRVELYLGKSNKKENKASYDYLMMNKVRIEDQLGTSLIWARGDDIKASKIFYEIDSTGIGSEENWSIVAKFHAEWSKKFYDVFTPILEAQI